MKVFATGSISDSKIEELLDQGIYDVIVVDRSGYDWELYKSVREWKEWSHVVVGDEERAQEVERLLGNLPQRLPQATLAKRGKIMFLVRDCGEAISFVLQETCEVEEQLS